MGNFTSAVSSSHLQYRYHVLQMAPMVSAHCFSKVYYPISWITKIVACILWQYRCLMEIKSYMDISTFYKFLFFDNISASWLTCIICWKSPFNWSFIERCTLWPKELAIYSEVHINTLKISQSQICKRYWKYCNPKFWVLKPHLPIQKVESILIILKTRHAVKSKFTWNVYTTKLQTDII